MNILIYGYGLKGGGFDIASYFLKRNNSVRITDIRSESSLGESAAYLKSLGVELITGCHRVEDFEWADIVVKTPAISPGSPFLDYSKKTMNDFSFLFSDKRTEKVKLVFITGTVGKTITSSAVCHALKKLGKKARMCGNMGISPFTELNRWENSNIPEYLICELSSWQMRDTFTYLNEKMPEIELAVITNAIDDGEITSANIQQYFNEKMSLFGADVKSVLCPEENKDFIAHAMKIKGKRLSTIENCIKGKSKELPANLKSAFSVLKKLGFHSVEINNALKSFKGVPHRNEFVIHKDNLLVINDSAATIPQAANFTLDNYKGLAVHLICGGTGKGLNAQCLAENLKNLASITLLSGSFTKKEIIPLLEQEGIKFTGPFDSMNDAVQSVKEQLGQKNAGTEVILLSPGASAFEFFANEYDRGEKFIECFSK